MDKRLKYCLFIVFPFSDSIQKCTLISFILFLLNLPAIGQKTARVQFSAATTEVDEKLGKDTKRLLGNVVFTHGGSKMYCDSAYFHSKKNSLDAYNNVYINQGDTTHLYGDYLYYDGNTKIAQVRKNVKLINRETTLTTDALDYNLSNSIGYYTNHANIINEENNLESKIGYYYTKQDLFDFQDSVVVINPDYTIYSDRLKYNTETKITYFFGPTEIFSDSSYIYCERGWYNTLTDISQLNQNAVVKNQNQTVMGDSLYYEKYTGFGRAVKNVVIIDNEQNVILKGNRGIYYEDVEYARITEKAQFIQVSKNDSLYLSADTLLSEVDTSGTKLIKAYYGVRIFKSDLQGKCDSMAYSFADSVIRLYESPVLWNEDNQLSAEYIEIHTENRQAKTMYMYKSSFIINMADSTKYNQIKGKNMTCHFRNNELYRIDVNGNGQTVYYPEDEKGITEVNKAECSDLIIYLKDGEVDMISLLKKPDATVYPVDQAPMNELILRGFAWLDDLRPKDKNDIFR
ncbi:MAG: organic solvent tolerance protein OstA [Bacteroidales bacterium]|nr:organic solvent tolerance protein OstA [Bacteroidales bacterium]